MADGDRIRGMPARYRTVFEQLCVGQLGPDMLAHNLAQRLKRDLQEDGDEPFHALLKLALRFTRVLCDLKKGQEVSWIAVYDEIRELAAAGGMRKTPMNRVIAVCGRFLHQIESGVAIRIPQVPEVFGRLVADYLDHLYASRFADHAAVRMTEPPASDAGIAAQLAAVQPFVAEELAVFGRALLAWKSVRKLRVRPHKRETIDLDADLTRLSAF